MSSWQVKQSESAQRSQLAGKFCVFNEDAHPLFVDYLHPGGRRQPFAWYFETREDAQAAIKDWQAKAPQRRQGVVSQALDIMRQIGRWASREELPLKPACVIQPHELKLTVNDITVWKSSMDDPDDLSIESCVGGFLAIIEEDLFPPTAESAEASPTVRS